MPLVTVSSPAPRASAWEWAQAALLAGNLAWTTLALGGYRAETKIVTLVLTGALVVVHFLSCALERGDTQLRAHPAGWLLLPFLVYAAANVQWVTPVRWLGWMDWLGWAQMIAVFWVTLNGIRARPLRQALFLTLTALGIVGVVLACYQRFVQPDWVILGRTWPGDFGGRSSGSFGIPNSFAGYLLLLLPAVGALALRRTAKPTERVWWGWVSAVLLFGLLLTISRGAWMALAVALIIWPLAGARGGWWRRVRMALGAAGVVALVTAIVVWKSPKIRARFTALVLDAGERTRPIMWRAAWNLFRAEPVLGTGAGSYNVQFERQRPEKFPDEPLWAHNEYLNTLSDYGAIGFILFFGACGAITVRCVRPAREEKIRRRDHWLDSPAVGSALGVGLLAFAVQLALDFHFKIPALTLASAVIAALAVGRAWPMPDGATGAKPATRIAGSAVAFVAVLGAGWCFVPLLHGEALRREGRLRIDRLGAAPSLAADYQREVPLAHALLIRATTMAPSNAQAWADLAYATSLRAVTEPERRVELGAEAEKAAVRALALCRLCNEFWIRRGTARDLQGRWLEAGDDFSEAVRLAPNEAYAWYFYAEHLFRRRTTHESAEAALTMSLRLDPGNALGLALRQRLAITPRSP